MPRHKQTSVERQNDREMWTMIVLKHLHQSNNSQDQHGWLHEGYVAHHWSIFGNHYHEASVTGGGGGGENGGGWSPLLLSNVFHTHKKKNSLMRAVLHLDHDDWLMCREYKRQACKHVCSLCYFQGNLGIIRSLGPGNFVCYNQITCIEFELNLNLNLCLHFSNKQNITIIWNMQSKYCDKWY